MQGQRSVGWRAVFARWSLVLAAWAVAPAIAGAEVIAVGPAGALATLEEALARARDGDVVELLAGEYPGGLLIDRRKLTLRGLGKVVVKGDGKAGPAKALWTVRGGEVTIEGIQFRGMRSQDSAGAGIRQEGGKLTLRKVECFDNEYGVLALNDEQAELTIDSSVIGAAPKVVGGLYHLLNVGRIGKLTVTGSRFQQGFEGHLIRSRARETTLAYNFIHDSLRGGASYEIEIAAGGLATVIGNVIGQGADSQNPVVLAYGTEGKAWERNELRVVHNTFVHYGWLPAWFMRVFNDRLPEGTKVWAVNNLLVGPGIFWLGASGEFSGNRNATRGMLRDIDTYGFELPPGSTWRGSGVDPRSVGGVDLTPKGEFEWPVGVRELQAGATSWTPGAFQR